MLHSHEEVAVVVVEGGGLVLAVEEVVAEVEVRFVTNFAFV